MKRHLSLVLGLLTTVALGAACGSDGGSDHNANDVTFAQGMIPHHRQAIEMAVMAPAQASSVEVKDLAARIKDQQSPEITAMTGWLERWGETVGDTPTGAGHDGSHGSGDGMMTDAEMQMLAGAQGAAFDTLFLQLMIKHHEGAITMAGTELEKGKNADAKMLAGSIREGQQSEIDEMRSLLDELDNT